MPPPVFSLGASSTPGNSPPPFTIWSTPEGQSSSVTARMIPLQFQRRRFTWDMEITNVRKAILGANFLSAQGLTVDLQQACVCSNEDPYLILPCSLHVLDWGNSVNHFKKILVKKFAVVAAARLPDLTLHRYSCLHPPPLHGETIVR